MECCIDPLKPPHLAAVHRLLAMSPFPDRSEPLFAARLRHPSRKPNASNYQSFRQKTPVLTLCGPFRFAFAGRRWLGVVVRKTLRSNATWHWTAATTYFIVAGELDWELPIAVAG
jgi:hypothetical protein